MTQSCPIPTAVEKQAGEIMERIEATLIASMHTIILDATNQASDALKQIGYSEDPPAFEYFESLVHQNLFLRLCGADPDSLEGGNPSIAEFILENGRNISERWEK